MLPRLVGEPFSLGLIWPQPRTFTWVCFPHSDNYYLIHIGNRKPQLSSSYHQSWTTNETWRGVWISYCGRVKTDQLDEGWDEGWDEDVCMNPEIWDLRMFLKSWLREEVEDEGGYGNSMSIKRSEASIHQDAMAVWWWSNLACLRYDELFGPLHSHVMCKWQAFISWSWNAGVTIITVADVVCTVYVKCQAFWSGWRK